MENRFADYILVGLVRTCETVKLKKDCSVNP